MFGKVSLSLCLQFLVSLDSIPDRLDHKLQCLLFADKLHCHLFSCLFDFIAELKISLDLSVQLFLTPDGRLVGLHTHFLVLLTGQTFVEVKTYL